MSTTPKFTATPIPSLASLRNTVQCHSDGEINIGLSVPKVLIIQNDLLCSPCTAIASLIDNDIQYQVLYAFHDNAFKFIHPLILSKTETPSYIALLPSSSSILRSWLYFATRSDLEREPVFICPHEYATERSEIKVSSVSPDL